MSPHWTLTALLILLLVGVVKAGYLFLRLAILAGMGLMGMYLMHKLAQDYNKIRGPMKAVQAAGRLLGIWKRSIPDEALFTPLHDEPPIFDPFKIFDDKSHFGDHLHPTFENVLKFDQNECTRRLVCQLASRKQRLNQNESTILKLIKMKTNQKESNLARQVFEEAANVGYKSKDPKKCQEVFKKCRFTDKQMQRVIRVF
uniref:Uncharacterized protein n=1 Tax=Cacopsylla melanoneura TaxID=428564 RepID=A0A8D9E7S5_9HEMI